MDSLCFVMMLVLAMAAKSMSEECTADQDICIQKPPNYDKHLEDMERVYEQNKIFVREVNKLDDIDETPSRSRVGDEQNCWSTTEVIQPYAIKSNVTTELIIQLPDFVQKIRTTKCWNNKPNKRECFQPIFKGSNTIKAECDEKYSVVSLYIYDPKDDKMKYLPFDVPVACSCKFRRLSSVFGK